MVAEAEVVCQQNVGVLDVKHFPNKGSDVHQIGDADANSPPCFDRVRATESVSAELLTSQEVSFLKKTPFFHFSCDFVCFCCWMAQMVISMMGFLILSIRSFNHVNFLISLSGINVPTKKEKKN